MQIRVPEKLVPTQLNIAELLSDFWASFNLDLTSEPGKVRISQRTAKISASSDGGLSALLRPAAFIRTSARGSDEWWALCNQGLFYSNGSSDPTTPFIADATGSSPTTALDYEYSDFEEFSGDLITSLKTDIAKLSGGTWDPTWWSSTLSKRALVTGIPHPLKVGFNNLILIGDQVVTNNEAGKGEKAGQASVHAIDISSNVSLNRLLFKKSLKVVFIISSNNEYWIGLSHTKGGKAEVAYWDGSSINFNQSYKINDTTLVGGVIDNDGVPNVVDGKGRLLKFNGRGFAKVAQLPIFSNKYYRWASGASFPMHKNGICLIDGRINMLIAAGINTDSKGGIENFWAGIWEYDEDIGLYHKHGITNTHTAGVLDFGSPIIRRPGALVETEKRYGTLLGGVELATDNDTTLIGVVFNLDTTDTTLKQGFFITKKMLTRAIEEHWQEVCVQFSKLLNTTDKIYAKYRTDFKNYGVATYKVITWANSLTQFTSASSQIWSDVSVGDEVFVLTGKGAGICAKITAISLVASTYTITLDYTFTGVSTSDLALVQVRNWTTLPYNTSQDYINDQTIRYQDLPVGDKSTEIQYKIVVFAKGNSPEIGALFSKSEENVSLNR